MDHSIFEKQLSPTETYHQEGYCSQKDQILKGPALFSKYEGLFEEETIGWRDDISKIAPGRKRSRKM